MGKLLLTGVGAKRQNAHKNVVDAAKATGVQQIIYTSLVNAADASNPSIEKIDHIFTEDYIKEAGMDHIFSCATPNMPKPWSRTTSPL